MISFGLCVYVSVRVPKTDNFITTSHFAFNWGVGPIQACPSVRLSVRVRPGPGVCPGLFAPPRLPPPVLTPYPLPGAGLLCTVVIITGVFFINIR